MTIEQIIEGHTVSDARKASLLRAIELGATNAQLVTIRDVPRLNKNARTILLPAHRYESLSRGRGWCRQGTGDKVTWGYREDKGYRVGPGRWTVGATDGFSRKDSTEWRVFHLTIGTETWTLAE